MRNPYSDIVAEQLANANKRLKEAKLSVAFAEKVAADARARANQAEAALLVAKTEQAKVEGVITALEALR